MTADEQETTKATNKRERSPGFPYLSLGDCIDLLGRLNEVARSSEVLVKDLAEPWGLTPSSGSLLRYVAAVSAYGLITAQGSGDNRKVKISEEGRRILEDERPGIRERLCHEAAIKPALIKNIYYGTDGREGWGKNRPSDNIAISNLKFDFKFTPDGAKRFLSVYDDTIRHIIDDDDSGERVDVTPDSELKEDDKEDSVTYGGACVGDLIQWESDGILQLKQPTRVRSVTDDGVWVFVEGSETGIPMNETIVEQRAPEITPPTLPIAATAEGEKEWVRTPLGKGAYARILVTDDLSDAQIEKLRVVLDAMKEE